MKVNGMDALLILKLADQQDDMENWLPLLKVVYTKEDEDITFTTNFLKFLIRQLEPDCKHSMVFRRTIAYELLQRLFPEDCPRSDDEQALVDALAEDAAISLQEKIKEDQAAWDDAVKEADDAREESTCEEAGNDAEEDSRSESEARSGSRSEEVLPESED